MGEKSILSLRDDIYELVDKGADIPEEQVQEFSNELANIVKDRLSGKSREPYLRLSNLGTRCNRRLWYQLNQPEKAEPLSPVTKLKFLIGDVWEAVLLFLAKASGHRVEGQQQKMNLHGVIGHRDAVIDGVLVDVKSASSRSFIKFENHLSPETDDFGYLTQLNAYAEAGKDDPVVTEKNKMAFLAGDKTLGKIHLDIHNKDDTDWEKVVSEKKEMIGRDEPPERGFEDVPDGKSGNRKLQAACTYCEFRDHCWENLEKFNYASGPRWLTKVVRIPKVDKDDYEPF